MIGMTITRIVLVSALLMVLAFATIAPSEDGCPACIEISAYELYAAYEADEEAAEEKYGDKWVRVEGDIRKISQGSQGILYVTLIGGESGGVQFIFDKEDAEKLDNLSEGQTVVLKGTVKGKDLDKNVLVNGAW